MKAEDVLRHLYGSNENPHCKLLCFLFRFQPDNFYFCNISLYAKKTKLSHVTVRNALNDFKAIGIVKEYRSAKNKIFIPIKSNDFFELLYSREAET